VIQVPLPNETYTFAGGVVAGYIMSLIIRMMVKILIILISTIGVLEGVLAWKGWITINKEKIEEDILGLISGLVNNIGGTIWNTYTGSTLL